MTPAAVLVDTFQRVSDDLPSILDGLSEEDLAWRPTVDANPIGWLIWHLLRVQDDHVAEVADVEQVWTSRGFADRFDLPFEPDVIGYGQSAEEVGRVRVSAALLMGYGDAVQRQTISYLGGLSDSDLDRIVDDRWDPPVTLGARLVSVLNDDTQHLGQAAYVRGLLPGR